MGASPSFYNFSSKILDSADTIQYHSIAKDKQRWTHMITILRIKQISNIDHRPSKVQVQHNKTLETISSCFIRLIEALHSPTYGQT
jgi:hypothetical protein